MSKKRNIADATVSEHAGVFTSHEIDYLVGKLLTIIDVAIGEEDSKNKATKDVIRDTVWDWYNSPFADHAPVEDLREVVQKWRKEATKSAIEGCPTLR